MTTGTGIPGSRFWVVALNTLQNSMMLSPRWPRAGPIGGDGFALPAGTCNLMIPTIFFAMRALYGSGTEHGDMLVTPAEAGVQDNRPRPGSLDPWIPAFAGMTK